MRYFKIIIASVAPLVLAGCGATNRPSQSLQRPQEVASSPAPVVQRRDVELQAMSRVLSDLDRMLKNGEITQAEYWRRGMKAFQKNPAFTASFREFHLVAIEIATRFDNKLITREKYDAEIASAMTRLEMQIKQEQAIEAARNSATLQANQAIIDAENARRARRQADTDSAIGIFGAAADLARPTVVSPTVNAPSGPRIYNFNGKQTICTTTGNITNCN